MLLCTVHTGMRRLDSTSSARYLPSDPIGTARGHASKPNLSMGLHNRRPQACTQHVAGGGCRQALDGGLFLGIQPILDAVGAVHLGTFQIVRGQQLELSIPYENLTVYHDDPCAAARLPASISFAQPWRPAADRLQHLSYLGYLLVGVAAAAPCFLLPLWLQPPAEARKPLLQRHWVRANVWMAIFSYIGNYFWTHYFYTLLGAQYTFNTWRLNDVSPFAIALHFQSQWSAPHQAGSRVQDPRIDVFSWFDCRRRCPSHCTS
jgi:hypothetical protein